MKKFFVALLMLLTIPAFATGVGSTASTADCDNATLNTYTGTSNLSAGWQPNTIALHWYNGDTEITSGVQTSCTYDGTLTPPSTIPTKTGYTFKGWRVRSVLPAGYTRLEYIQSSGTQYIKTSIIADLNTKADIKFAKTQENGYSAVFGARTSATSRAFNAWVPLSSGFIGANLSSNGSIASNVHCTTNTLYVLSLSGTQLSVNGNITTITSASSFTTPGGLWLFNTNGGGTSTSGTSNRVFVGKIYYFNVYQSDNLVLELIPAKRNSDNVVGMWDTVSKTFFTNAGTGSFIAGPVVSD